MSNCRTSNEPNAPQRGRLYVFSAPSGGGKQTILNEVRRRDTKVASTVSVTTRAPRPGEQDGVDYYFVDRAAFEQRRDRGDFLEWAAVHGHLYGTLRSEMERCLVAGCDVILELDVQGMRSLKALHPEVVTIFLAPPSMAELERRLRARGTNDEADIALRLRNAAVEMAAQSEFDYIIINDTIDQAAGKMVQILDTNRSNDSLKPDLEA